MQTHSAPGPVLKQQVLLACPNGTVLVGANEEVQGCFGEDGITNMVILILKDHAIKSP